METLQFFGTTVNDRYIEQAAEALRRGEIVVYPTDSLYALGCDALNKRAAEQLCRIKGINPEKNLLSIVCADISSATEYVMIDNRAFALLKEYTPGPVTFILPAVPRLAKTLRSRRTVGIRIPDNGVARALAAALGSPILTTSVPVEKGEEILFPDDLATRFADCASLTLDNGEALTDPTTIVDLTDSSAPEIVRAGKAEINL